MIDAFYWLIGATAYLIIGEAVAAFTAVLLPQTLKDKHGRFLWHLASLRVVLWWLVLLFGFVYALSIPVRSIHRRVRAEAPASGRQVI
jgi:uncharacterized membrane protein YhaH (DUF805 family)